LGVIKGGPQLIRKLLWFIGFDWDVLNQNNMEVPIKPTVKSLDVLGNFAAEGVKEGNYELDHGDIVMSWANDF